MNKRAKLISKVCEYRHCKQRFKTRNPRRRFCCYNDAKYESAARSRDLAKAAREAGLG